MICCFITFRCETTPKKNVNNGNEGGLLKKIHIFVFKSPTSTQIKYTHTQTGPCSNTQLPHIDAFHLESCVFAVVTVHTLHLITHT